MTPLDFLNLPIDLAEDKVYVMHSIKRSTYNDCFNNKFYISDYIDGYVYGLIEFDRYRMDHPNTR